MAVVVGAILQMVQHLQRRAERVRWRPGHARLAVQIEQLPPDRRRRIAAIRHQIVPVSVTRFDRVEPERLEQVVAMLRRGPRFGQACAHRQSGRRIAARRALQYLGHAVEPAQLVFRHQLRVVGDIVGVAREAVERMHMRSQVAPDQPGADRKILAVPPLTGRCLDCPDL